MILNKDIPNGINYSQGEGSAITPCVLLYRCVIVRAIMDDLMLTFMHGVMQEKI